MRTTISALTRFIDISEHFIFGSTKGSSIHKLSPMFDGVVKMVLNNQILLPITSEKNVLHMKNTQAIDFSRPSDYRIKAIEAKNIKHTSNAKDLANISDLNRISKRCLEESKKAKTSENEGDEKN